MRRPFFLAVLLGAFLATPALADITVRYKAGPPNMAADAAANVPALTISADDAGNARLEALAPGTPPPGGRQPGVALVTREGTGYLVLNGPQPALRIVARQEDALALLVQFAGPLIRQGVGEEGLRQGLQARVEISPVRAETVAGVRGYLYRIVLVTGATRSPPLEIVIAADRRLAPIERELVRLTGALRPIFVELVGAEPQAFAAVRGLLALGAPLRIGDVVRLDSIDTADVPDERFALPGPVMSREQLAGFVQMMMTMRPGAPGTPPAPTPATPPTPPADEANPH